MGLYIDDLEQLLLIDRALLTHSKILKHTRNNHYKAVSQVQDRPHRPVEEGLKHQLLKPTELKVLEEELSEVAMLRLLLFKQ